MSGLYGYSADCFNDDCEQPDGCDCDCHLDVNSGDDYPWPDDVFLGDWGPRLVETVRVPVLEAGEAS